MALKKFWKGKKDKNKKTSLVSGDRDKGEKKGSKPGNFSDLRALGIAFGTAIVGTAATLGLIYMLRSIAGDNSLIQYVYSLVFERGNIQFLTMFFFWFAMGLLLNKHLQIAREISCFNDSAIQTFRERVCSKTEVGAKTIIGLLESFQSACENINPLPVLYNRILQGLKQARISENQADVANVLENVEETDYLQMESSYNMIKFFIWIIPILGFFGTLIGMSESIGSFQGVFSRLNEPDTTKNLQQILSHDLKDVTGGLALAFDTTLLALMLSAVLNFLMTSLIRREENFLVQVHDFVLENIINRFSSVKEQMPAQESYVDRIEEGRHRELVNALNNLSTVFSNRIDGLEACFDNLQAQQRESGRLLGEQIARFLDEIKKISSAAHGAGQQQSPPPLKALGATGDSETTSKLAKTLSGLNERMEVLSELPEILGRLSEAIKQQADLQGSASADLSPLADLNDQLARNADALDKLGDFKHHLVENGGKIDRVVASIQELVEVNRKMGEAMEEMLSKGSGGAAPDFSLLAQPLEELNQHMSRNAEAVEKLGDFKQHLVENTEKLEEITSAIKELTEMNRKLGKVMASIIEKQF